MFEDSLVESEGRIRTRSRWSAIGSLLLQGALLLAIVIEPLSHPQRLPQQSLERLLIAPPPPPARIEVDHAPVPASPRPSLPSMQQQIQAPARITSHIAQLTDSSDPSPAVVTGLGLPADPGMPGGLPLGPAKSPAVIMQKPAAKSPVPISSGVAAGQLLSPIRPIYPVIAKQARIQGTVIIEATISRQGAIDNLHVVDGPPLLRQAAVDAVANARYRPFLLNGEPVEVQTSIRVIFSLGG